MNISEHRKISATGFSAKRVAYVVAALGFVGIPFQFADARKVGEAAGWFGLLVVFASILLCFIQPRGTPKRFHPVALSLIALILQLLLVHL